MSTPATAEVRAWARAQGIAVAARGRVPAEVHEAYLASTSGKPAAAGAGRSTATASASKPAVRKAAGKAPARKAPAKAPTMKAPTTKAPARKAPARSTPASSAPASSAPATASPALTATVDVPSAAPAAPVTAVDEGRLARLEEQVSALTARVAELEKPQAPKAALFRRKKG